MPTSNGASDMMFARKTNKTTRLMLMLALLGALLGCSGMHQLEIPDPIPRDDRDIPKPKKRKIHNVADGFDKQFARPVERAFDFSRQFRRLTGNRKEALNLDAFDEVGNSTWFTNRNGRRTLTIDEIKRGPNTGEGPDVTRLCTIIGAKSEGVTPGFTIEDGKGGRYIIKFDPKGWPELATGAEVVSTKLLYAAGYNTPENYIVHIDPSLLKIGDDVLLKENGKKRLMTQADLDDMLARVNRGSDGTYRAVASKFLDGKLLGPFRYYKTRKDDPNDFIPHEHRRELRGLRTIAAWVNHWDTKAGNTLDVYVEEDGRHFVRHYLIDFGSTLGSQGDEPMPEWTGYETTVDPGQILENTYTLGLKVPAWEKDRVIHYKSIGLFDWQHFEPQEFKFIVPNPAFVNQTDRDGLWGAKIVTSFTDEQIRAAVETGEYTNPDAASYLVDVLIKRRDIIGRYWLGRANPIDQFEVLRGEGGDALRCVDLAVERGYRDRNDARYQYQILKLGEESVGRGETGSPMRIELPARRHGFLEIRIRNQKESGEWGRWVSAYLNVEGNPGEYSVLAIRRWD